MASEASRNWDAELAPLVAAWAQARDDGDAARAQALHAEAAALLADGMTTLFARAREDWAARRDHGAFSALDAALGLHRWALPDVAPPVARAALYRALSELYAAWGQPMGVAAALALSLRGGRSLYPRPHLCQIPVLEGLYEQLFGQRTDGRFVEVGAFDGETYGNTAGLADLGWAGLYIEPVPAAFEQCRRRHQGNPAVTVLNCAIGATEGAAELWVAREFSTLSRAHVDRSIASGWMSPGAYQRITVAQRRLAGVLAGQGIAPGFELLVIDVEGAELQVLAGADLASWRPQVVIAELVDFEPVPGQTAGADAAAVADARAVRAELTAAGYDAVYADFTNTVFRRAT